MAIPDLQKVNGENATMSVDGLDILVDGDIELNMEREVYEWKVRGVPVTQHISSKRQTISGGISGVPTNAVVDVLKQYLGVSASLDATTTFDSVSLPNVTITFTFMDTTDKVTLSDVHLKSLKVSAKDGEPIRIESDFVANKITLG